MSSPYRFKMEQRVIVKEPNGMEYTGVIAHRRQLPGREINGTKLVRYTILDDHDQAHTLIPSTWIRADEQLDLIDAEHAQALEDAVNGGGI